ncbi:hypothetical protein F2P81_005177 [Scophthalmus maximus]|uniref:Uncharacterized protein n=1 Tax=Scophthalmus maximus TaxID=52904 RepID=A0A6A4T8X2_SCOMX|nr:hypothetical protein F2P81_005177 [Scophthalmus maximus]
MFWSEDDGSDGETKMCVQQNEVEVRFRERRRLRSHEHFVLIIVHKLRLQRGNETSSQRLNQLTRERVTGGAGSDPLESLMDQNVGQRRSFVNQTQSDGTKSPTRSESVHDVSEDPRP